MRSTNLLPSAYKYPPFTPFHPIRPLFTSQPAPSSAAPESAGSSPEHRRRRKLFIEFLSSASHRVETSSPATPTTANSIPMSSSTPPPSTSEPIMATPISSAPPIFAPVHLEPQKDSGKDIEGTSANPEDSARADQAEKKTEEAATKKSKARARDSEAKGKWWPCTTTETELRNLEAEGFLKPGSWQTIPGALTPAPEAGEWVVTKALVERGFSLPPSDFFLEILKAYELQPHHISPNSILAISNHVALCEGHLRVTLELSLFQFYFSVKKEKIAQTSTLATCGGVTFKLRPGACTRTQIVMNLCDTLETYHPPSETPAWIQCPHLSESPQLTQAVRRICKLTEEGLSGKDLTMSWFTKRIQPLQHRDRLLFEYTGREDSMCASKDNLSADALDKRIRVLIKVPRDLRIHVCNIDIHTNGSGTALEALEDKDLGTLTRVPHAGNTDPEVASDTEAPVAPAPSKRKRGASSGFGPTAKRTRDVASTAATRKAEAEKKCPKLIDTSNQNQPNIHQFFMTSTKNPGTKPPKNPKKKAKPSPATMPVTPQAEGPPKPSSSTAVDPKDVINLDDLPEDPITESGHGGSGKGDSGKDASSSHPPPERQDTTSAEATAHDAENKMTEEQMLTKLEGEIKVFFAQHKHVRQNTQKLHEDLRVHVLEQKTEIDGLRQSYADSQKAITHLETRIKNNEEEIAKRPSIDALAAKVEVLEAENESLKKFLKESFEEETMKRKELSDKHIQEVSDLAENLKKSQNRVKTLAGKNKAQEAEAEAIDKLIFPTLGFDWTKELALKTSEAYEEARSSIDDLIEACRGIAQSLSLKRAGTKLVDTMTKLMWQVPELIKDCQESSARGVASLALATCKAHFPTMNFADIARGAPKGTNMRAALAETQGYDRVFAGQVNHSFWYNKYDLPAGFSDAKDEEEEAADGAEEGSGSSDDHSQEASGYDSGEGSAYNASDDDQSSE
ncbi:hypothetical protein QYE76_043231 [Lolium multiflorum]|uniref:Transposase (putative) gypsy type domain-containing protein n=1 Tax=Lolium multiflorum TaxID=4521 RepID=A0AAD8WY17_LOLMU|nr:hypothetical protein QYE76_043231 [Lolium multiflorum]